MGADLIVAWCDAPHDESGRYLSSPAAQDALIQRIETLSDEALADACETFFGEAPEPGEIADEEDFALDNFGHKDWRAGARGLLRDAVNEVFTADRNITLTRVHGHYILIGGGTSWGETPEGYDSVALLGNARLTEAPIETQDTSFEG